MRSKKDGTPSEPASSAEASAETPSTTPEAAAPEPAAGTGNAFETTFLARMDERNEPATAAEADLAGPWHLERLPSGRFGLYRRGRTHARGHDPKAIFATHELALQAMALLPLLGKGDAYRLRQDDQGYVLESREDWSAVVGHLARFDPDLVPALSVLERLARSPWSLALFLESCGKVALEHAGAILEARVWEME